MENPSRVTTYTLTISAPEDDDWLMAPPVTPPMSPSKPQTPPATNDIGYHSVTVGGSSPLLWESLMFPSSPPVAKRRKVAAGTARKPRIKNTDSAPKNTDSASKNTDSAPKNTNLLSREGGVASPLKNDVIRVENHKLVDVQLVVGGAGSGKTTPTPPPPPLSTHRTNHAQAIPVNAMPATATPSGGTSSGSGDVPSALTGGCDHSLPSVSTSTDAPALASSDGIIATGSSHSAPDKTLTGETRLAESADAKGEVAAVVAGSKCEEDILKSAMSATLLATESGSSAASANIISALTSSDFANLVWTNTDLSLTGAGQVDGGRGKVAVYGVSEVGGEVSLSGGGVDGVVERGGASADTNASCPSSTSLGGRGNVGVVNSHSATPTTTHVAIPTNLTATPTILTSVPGGGGPTTVPANPLAPASAGGCGRNIDSSTPTKTVALPTPMLAIPPGPAAAASPSSFVPLPTSSVPVTTAAAPDGSLLTLVSINSKLYLCNLTADSAVGTFQPLPQTDSSHHHTHHPHNEQVFPNTSAISSFRIPKKATPPSAVSSKQTGAGHHTSRSGVGGAKRPAGECPSSDIPMAKRRASLTSGRGGGARRLSSRVLAERRSEEAVEGSVCLKRKRCGLGSVSHTLSFSISCSSGRKWSSQDLQGE